MIASLYANAAGPLRDGVVHVWRFACRQDVGRWLAVLSEDEVRAAKRFAAPEDRDSYVVQRAMMRCLLAPYVDMEPHGIAFVRALRGKPRIAGGRGLELNLSHADDVALLAISRGMALGVDLERFDADLDLDALAPIVLAPAETYRDRRGFLRIWCRKEACLKATGVGLLDDLTTVSVLDERVEVAGATVYVQDLAVSDAHAAALATATTCAAISAVELETRVVTS